MKSRSHSAAFIFHHTVCRSQLKKRGNPLESGSVRSSWFLLRAIIADFFPCFICFRPTTVERQPSRCKTSFEVGTLFRCGALDLRRESVWQVYMYVRRLMCSLSLLPLRCFRPTTLETKEAQQVFIFVVRCWHSPPLLSLRPCTRISPTGEYSYHTAV